MPHALVIAIATLQGLQSLTLAMLLYGMEEDACTHPTGCIMQCMERFSAHIVDAHAHDV